MSGGVVVGIAITAVVLILAAGLSTLWVSGERRANGSTG